MLYNKLNVKIKTENILILVTCWHLIHGEYGLRLLNAMEYNNLYSVHIGQGNPEWVLKKKSFFNVV